MDSGVHFKSSIVHSIISADVAQSVVRLICNQKVAGSIPVISSISKNRKVFIGRDSFEKRLNF